MAAAQAAMIETIVSMKRALAREADASDSDETIYQPTNRGNKLKRNARYVHEGQLDRPNGPRVYKRKIEHAGYQRYIINRKPLRLDEDGDELDDDDIDEEADAAAAESNPYADIKLEHLLAPLTSVADLLTHPTLSKPYLSNAIPRLTEQASSLHRKEKAALWRMKQLLTKFRGDETWAPCGMFETGNDLMLFGPSYTLSRPRAIHMQNKATTEIAQHDQHVSPIRTQGDPIHTQAAAQEASSTGQGDAEKKVKTPDNTEDIEMTEPGKEVSEPTNIEQNPQKSDQGRPPDDPTNVDTVTSNPDEPPQESTTTAPDTQATKMTLPDRSLHTSPQPTQPSDPSSNTTKPLPSSEPQQATDPSTTTTTSPPPPSHRMTTRLRAQATITTGRTSSHTPSASHGGSPSTRSYQIHPIFLVPASAQPDRDFGLPPAEAEETRRLLMLYCQKQEEVCRGSWTLYEGLLKADRLRKSVFQWAKAEAHVGEMSDGEDWYDKEEWGLEEDLKKGHDEDEDDAVGVAAGAGAGTPAGTGAGPGAERAKKTRARRA
ncbi:MAG: hypothetical protein M1816_005308 [Peltula sp. TS41687]|nr:MAG: hypothetical protein M1816_005308 [Peltula sp. TS41687]